MSTENKRDGVDKYIRLIKRMFSSLKSSKDGREYSGYFFTIYDMLLRLSQILKIPIGQIWIDKEGNVKNIAKMETKRILKIKELLENERAAAVLLLLEKPTRYRTLKSDLATARLQYVDQLLEERDVQKG